MARVTKYYQQILEVLWVTALVGLPVTSFPAFTNLTGALVAPLSGAPVLLLLAAFVLPALLSKRLRLPYESRVLVIFILIALAASAAAFFIEVPTFKGTNVFRQELRAFITLAIGMAFYLVFTTWPRSAAELHKALRWIHLGGLGMLLWGFTQVIFILTHAVRYPTWVIWIQDWFIQRPEYITLIDRVSGLAYEPSWFNHQMVILYLPLWLAATLKRQSVFRFRWLGLSIENLLLAVSLFQFALSGPRIGLLSVLLIVTFLFIRLNLALVRRLQQAFFTWLARLRQVRPHRMRGMKAATALFFSLLIIAVYAVLAVSAIILVSKRDWRLALLFQRPPTPAEIIGLLTLSESSILTLGLRLAFMERAIYWVTGWRTFGQFPWLGVGLGNSGFFFLKNVPALGWASYEIRGVIEGLSGLGNTKAFWVRLLAETGMLGFYTFLTWYFLMNKSARLLEKSREPVFQGIALAAQLALVAFIGEGFSIDSFAMPYLWVSLGLLSAASMVYRRELAAQPADSQPSKPVIALQDQ